MTAVPPPEKPAVSPAPSPSARHRYRGEGTSRIYQPLSWNAGQLFSQIISMLFFRLQVSGQSNIPKSGGVLMVTNHQSFLDPWLLGIGLSRQLHYMARDTLFKGGFLTYLLELWNAFPVKRGSSDLGAIRMAVDILDKGYILNIFPEGTRSSDGRIGKVAPGMVLILNRCKTDIPIVPTIIDGAYQAWPRNATFPHPHKIRICHGKPIPPSVWRKLSADDLALRIRADLVQLQKNLNSVHAPDSERQMLLDQASNFRNPTRKRRP